MFSLFSGHDKQKWKQNAITIAGGNGRGNQLNQLSHPHGIYFDDDHQCIYIADWRNDRIVEWKFGANNGKVVAGGNGPGNRMNQLNRPTDVIFDKKNSSLIICDCENRRVIEWSCQNGTKEGQTIISNIDCWGITMDNNGDLYVSDYKKNEVRRWKSGETQGIIVAGGNGNGYQLNQFDWPANLFVDKDRSVYVSDNRYHRVMKWMKGAKEGVIVAGGQGEGNSLSQLSYPQGVVVDQWENVYVADFYNHRIMCWSKGAKEGRVVVGGNGGEQSNQLNCPRGISFDRQGHLYVIDEINHRVQKFEVDS